MVYIALKIAKTREGGVLMLNNSGVFDYINALGTIRPSLAFNIPEVK